MTLTLSYLNRGVTGFMNCCSRVRRTVTCIERSNLLQFLSLSLFLLPPTTTTKLRLVVLFLHSLYIYTSDAALPDTTTRLPFFSACLLTYLLTACISCVFNRFQL